MAWTSPKTWTAEPLTSSDLNTHLRDNLNALKDPPSNKYTFNDSADWTTTSTSFVDIDTTDLSLAITTYGGDVLVHFFGTTTTSAGQIFFDFTVDGTRNGGDDGLVRVPSTLTPTSFTVLVEGLSAASHTFKMQWKVSSGTATLYAGAGTASNDVHGQFWVREVS